MHRVIRDALAVIPDGPSVGALPTGGPIRDPFLHSQLADGFVLRNWLRSVNFLGRRSISPRRRTSATPTCPPNVIGYYHSVIVSFQHDEAAIIWAGGRSRRLPSDIQPVALRKLRLLNNARRLDDLRIPPANRLEALKGDRRGQHSIRINDQWRICFVWKENNAHEVEIVDYH
jgi:proteic killer suppression protein